MIFAVWVGVFAVCSLLVPCVVLCESPQRQLMMLIASKPSHDNIKFFWSKIPAFNTSYSYSAPWNKYSANWFECVNLRATENGNVVKIRNWDSRPAGGRGIGGSWECAVKPVKTHPSGSNNDRFPIANLSRRLWKLTACTVHLRCHAANVTWDRTLTVMHEPSNADRVAGRACADHGAIYSLHVQNWLRRHPLTNQRFTSAW